MGDGTGACFPGNVLILESFNPGGLSSLLINIHWEGRGRVTKTYTARLLDSKELLI